jgi:hypothetical protein
MMASSSCTDPMRSRFCLLGHTPAPANDDTNDPRENPAGMFRAAPLDLAGTRAARACRTDLPLLRVPIETDS